MTEPTPIQRKPLPSCAHAPRSDAERLRILTASMRRRLGAIDATRHNLEQLLSTAEEIVEIMDRQEREAA